MNKLTIIVDKNIFQRTSVHNFSELTRDHSVILPHVLFEECLTTKKVPGSMHLLKKAETVIKAGAFISLSRGRMLKIERDTLQPLDSIIDAAGTAQIRDNNIEDLQINLQKEAQECNRSFEPVVHSIEKIAKAFWDTLSNRDYSKDWRQPGKDNDPYRRFGKWIRSFDKKQMKAWIAKLFPDISPHIQNTWITWHLLRLLLAYGIDWAYKRNLSGQSFDNFNITNDVYDIEYVLCLTRSDALLSHDTKLIIPLVKAIFPQKAIYSELKDIG